MPERSAVCGTDTPCSSRVERKREREEEQKRQIKARLKQGNSTTGKRGARGIFSPQNKTKKYQEP
ncbi:Hypothetical protein FKW44_012437 [Caligus rogercresseyi]|uniref:Uncharacterized protein n=1 Tax=Caligus rogercresseyi TaxID=217165 RepID=A0A7T8K9I6_CALRO|nr:Hypothetical protein FKW44_012437 [Caligus rogercresseyi]